jgi:hypothetical protein
MSEPLEAALSGDLALAAIERDLLRRARDLHRLGFRREVLRPAQMAAVAESIRAATDQPAAVAAVGKWMQAQLGKLRAKVERGERPSSWLVAPEGAAAGEAGESLGATLLLWLAAERYLPADLAPGLDRLRALQRFWAYFHGLYRYRAEIGEPMALHVLDLEREGEETR